VRVRGYAEGVPCWAEVATPDPVVAAGFYGALFGWAYEDGVFRLRGLAVAGLVESESARWLTYLAGDDLAGLVDLAVDAGGELVRTPVPASGYGRCALVADPSGAPFGVWQRGGLAGAQLASEPGTICFSDLATPDLSTAAAFYGKVFGWAAQPGELAPGWAYHDWLMGDRVVGGLVEVEGEPAQWRTTIEVADLDTVRDRCLDRHGSVVQEPTPVTVGRYARLADPYGATFGVIELEPELRAG
jgi:uncharacterized protein